MSPEQRAIYYTTFEPENSEQLQITPKGIAFTGFLGFEQRLGERYGKGIYLVVWVMGGGIFLFFSQLYNFIVYQFQLLLT